MITKHICKNGVRIILEHIPTVRSVTIGVWVGTGSRYETLETNGVSHFLEHMFFKGTNTRNAREIAEAFDGIGGHVNAFTSKEYTCFFAKVLDEKAKYALNILADMFFNSTFENDELRKERNVVLEEIKMYEDTPDDVVHDLLSSASFGDHALAYPILGTEETLRSFDRTNLKNYKNMHYTPDNVVISVAGNVNEDFIKTIEQLFGHYETSYSKPEYENSHFHTRNITQKKETEQAHLCLGFPGLAYGDEKIYDFILLNNILGGSMSSRLFQEVREDKGLAYSVFSFHSSYRDNGLLTIYAGTAPNQLDYLLETIFDVLKCLCEQGITEKELHTGKEQLKGSLMLSLESTNSRMSRNGKNELLLNKRKSLDEIIQSINHVTLSSVNTMARRVFTDEFSSSLISPSETKYFSPTTTSNL